MQTEENKPHNPLEPGAELHESNLPVPAKPSFQYITSVSIGVLVIILLAAVSYYGVAR